MFSQIFLYRLKRLTRQKEVLFWNLIFPIILGTLFSLAFSELNSGEHFNTIPVAVVYSDQEQTSSSHHFEQVLEELEKEKPAMVSVKRATAKEAETLLENRSIKGYYTIGDEVELTVAATGNSENMLQMILREYNQTYSTITTLAMMNQGVDPSFISSLIIESGNYLETETLTKGATDSTVIYFYTLIAMVCLYAANNGAFEILEIQADQSKAAARLACAPVSKLKRFAASTAATLVIQILQFVIVFIYLNKVLGVDFGDRYPYILLLGVVGSIVGILYGTCVGGLTKGDGKAKIMYCSMSILALCFLAGMMVLDMKYIIQEKFPVLQAVNPASRITDALYSLYYYEGLDRYWDNIIGLCIIGIVLFIITYFVFRRQEYESI